MKMKEDGRQEWIIRMKIINGMSILE